MVPPILLAVKSKSSKLFKFSTPESVPVKLLYSAYKDFKLGFETPVKLPSIRFLFTSNISSLVSELKSPRVPVMLLSVRFNLRKPVSQPKLLRSPFNPKPPKLSSVTQYEISVCALSVLLLSKSLKSALPNLSLPKVGGDQDGPDVSLHNGASRSSLEKTLQFLRQITPCSSQNSLRESPFSGRHSALPPPSPDWDPFARINKLATS
mmetsp:Transcript_4978/g.17458  ORF Transcript_4978/g.17458 Transcript_4978/m.17458 type:complete len:207 (+) Transcript_4978:3958-4578(+)